MELSKEEKINLLKMWISNINFHIKNLEDGIKQYPNSDIEGKPSRVDVLNDFLNKKTYYENALFELQNTD